MLFNVRYLLERYSPHHPPTNTHHKMKWKENLIMPQLKRIIRLLFGVLITIMSQGKSILCIENLFLFVQKNLIKFYVFEFGAVLTSTAHIVNKFRTCQSERTIHHFAEELRWFQCYGMAGWFIFAFPSTERGEGFMVKS